MPTRARDDELLLAFAAGASAAKAAERAGCSERTARRRMEDTEFRDKVNALRGEMVAKTAGRLAFSMMLAADRLRELLNAKSEGVCLGAARSLLELGAKLREATEIEERLAALEKAMKERGKRV